MKHRRKILLDTQYSGTMNGSGKEFNEIFLLEYIYALLPEKIKYLFYPWWKPQEKGEAVQRSSEKINTSPDVAIQ